MAICCIIPWKRRIGLQTFTKRYVNRSTFATTKEEVHRNLINAPDKLNVHNSNSPKTSKAPRGFWKDINTQRNALEKIGTQLGVKELNDWYSVDRKTITRELSFISNIYKGSLYTTLKEIYPQHDWNPLKFTKVPKGYWKDANTQRTALEKIGSELGVKELDDWYTVDRGFVTSKLTFISNYYNCSLYSTLKELYPQHNWDPLKFSKVPNNYWADTNTQRDALEKLGVQLGVKQLDDWYNISGKNVISELNFIKHYYQGSLYITLKELYPQHVWDPLKFSQIPRGFWQKSSTIEEFRSIFEKWKQQYDIHRLKDWYQLPPEQLKLFHKASYGIFGSVTKMLQEWFPDTKWTDEIHGSTPELQLQTMLQLVAPDVKLHHRIGQHTVDIFIPEWNVAIEYQGLQHYQQHWRGDFNQQKQRDEVKKYLLQEETPVSLVPVSYQWNGTWSQLRSTIRSVRPVEMLTKDSKVTKNIFAEDIKLNEVIEAVKSSKKFFTKRDCGSYYTFNYSSTKLPTFKHEYFQSPDTAPDSATKRLRQIYHECRGLKICKSGRVLCRPFHKFFSVGEMPGLNLQHDMIEHVTEKYEGIMIAPVKPSTSEPVSFVTRTGGRVSGALLIPNDALIGVELNEYLENTKHAEFAEYIISKQQTPIFEFIKSPGKPRSLVLLAIRNNITGEYASLQSIKEEAEPFNIVVAKEWPVPLNLDKLQLLTEIKGIEGFVIKQWDGNMFKLQTQWWREKQARLNNMNEDMSSEELT